MAVNTMRLDPTRTTMLRRAFVADMQRRMTKIRRAIIQLVVTEDAFGLDRHGPPVVRPQTTATHTTGGLALNTRWEFSTDDKKIDAYQTWLKGQVDQNLLTVDPQNKNTPWLQPYIGKAYKKGVERAYTDSGGAKGEDLSFIEGGKAAFMKMSFEGPVMQSKLKTLTTRAFTNLKGVTADMDKQMTTILATGLAKGTGTAELGKQLAASVDGLSVGRAATIARTEVIHAHNEGQLDSFEAMNMEGVGVMAEWSTAHDGHVCPLCAPLEGVVLKIAEARGLLPRHPNCRCAWIPAGVGEEEDGTTESDWSSEDESDSGKTTGQVWSKDEIGARIRESFKAESPNLDTVAARAESSWAGADLKITGKLKPGSKAYEAALAEEKAATSIAYTKEKEEAEAAAAERATAKSEKIKAALAKQKPIDEAEAKLAEMEPVGFTGNPNPNGKYIKVPMANVDFATIPKELLDAAQAGTAETVTLKIEDLIATQPVVKRETVDHFIHNAQTAATLHTDPIRVLKYDGKYYVIDGTHRTTAEVLKGTKEIEVKLIQNTAVEKKLAEEATAQAVKEAEAKITEEAAKTAGGWFGEAGADVAALDHADYSAVAGWGAPPANKTQSYGTILFDNKGRVLMREPKKHFGGVHWTFAKGGGTQPGTTALKELAEETGYKGSIHDILPGAFTGQKTKTNYFLGRAVGYDATLMDGETTGVKWMTFNEAKAAIALSKDAEVAARDREVLEAAFKHITSSNGGMLKELAANGTAKLKAMQDEANAAVHAHKVKTGMAQKHFTKEKFGGGITDADYVAATKQKLGPTGLNKVLSEKGWHLSTLSPVVGEALTAADDIVAQKAIIDDLKKAGKGVAKIPLAGDDDVAAGMHDFVKEFTKTKAPAALPEGARVVKDDFIYTSGWEEKELKTALEKGATAKAGRVEAAFEEFSKGVDYENMDPKELIGHLNEFKKANPELYATATTTAPVSPITAPVAPTPGASGVPLEKDLKKIKDLPGSTKPYLAEDTATGGKWVVKDVEGSGIKPAHLRSEANADQLYRTLGFAVPKSTIIESAGGPMKVSQYLDGGQTLAQWKAGKSEAEVKAMYKEIRKGYVADALFANHDVAGLSYDNIFIHNATPYRIDNGGALTFRAQGGKKAGWGPKVTDLATMKDKATNAVTASIYDGITDDEVHAQIRHIVANRDALLAAVEDDKTRATLAARIDDLEAKLPAQAARQTATGGQGAGSTGITAQTPQRVAEARVNGHNIAVDRADVEDNNVLAWEALDAKGQPVTTLQLKVTATGSNKIKDALGDELKSATALSPTSNVHPDDDYYPIFLKTVKTINTHQKDGKYNEGTVMEFQKSVVKLQEELEHAKGDKKKMLEHYAASAEGIEAAMQQKAFTKEFLEGPLKQYVHTPPEVKEADTGRRLRRDIRVRQDSAVAFPTAEFKGGVAQEVAGGQNRFSTDNAYMMDMGEGIQVHYLPRNNSYAADAGRALHGTVRVTVPAKATAETLNKAMGMLREIGIDTAAPTPAYEESVYLHKGVYLNKKSQDPAYMAIWGDKGLSDAERVVAQKKWIKANMGVDVDKVPSYNPAGTTKNADGTGYRHWERWDLPAEKIKKDMAGYTLTHSPSSGIEETLRGVLRSGGEFTSTTGRIRKGVDVRATGGMSSNADVNTGGASYFFTRIKKPGDDTPAFHFKIDNLARLDTVSYGGDKYGAISELGSRATTTAQYKKYAADHGSNETLFKEGLGIGDLDTIVTRDAAERGRVLQVFKERGMDKLPDGRPVTDLVVTREERRSKR